MNMKKTIALLLTLVMALSLVACGGTGKTASTPSVEPPAETTLAASNSTDTSVSEVPAELTKVVSLAPATTQIIDFCKLHVEYLTSQLSILIADTD